MQKITRKSLLYKSNVEYGNWTINHVSGCMHGCKFPCYAYMLSKRFGRTKDYNDWRKPKLVANALQILEKEIKRYGKELDLVHLCFMTDPFMYDSEKEALVPEVLDMTLKIIKRLNREGIRVTTLTKGVYPDNLLSRQLMPDNEYGITLVSLQEKFRKEFEPFSASYQKRIQYLKNLYDSGAKTWISIEPYPTPNLDPGSVNIVKLLERVSFVDKIIFGKMNYNIDVSKFKSNNNFYKTKAGEVINFCKKNNIQYHIKAGTPYSSKDTESIFQN
ncbi:radical SAM protein [Candidatus Poribacteria bacterium]|nr:radical SAM protein [Candidatus Poribacteria bacterium]